MKREISSRKLNGNYKYAQSPQTVSTLRKKWYFLPGKEFCELREAQLRYGPEMVVSVKLHMFLL